MVATLNMSRQLLELGRDHLADRRTTEGLRVLRRLLDLPDVPPAVAAEANFLMAQVYFERTSFNQAEERLNEALAQTPEHADSHYLLGRVMELEGDGSQRRALAHFAHARKFAPADARKQSAYGLQLARTKNAGKGLKLLERAYAQQDADPAVVEDFVEGLIATNRMRDAELVLTQACYRHPGEHRLRELRRRFHLRALAGEVERRPTAGDDEPCILPFRTFAAPGRIRVRTRRHQPVAAPAATTARPAAGAQAAAPTSAGGGSGALLVDLLRRIEADSLRQLYAAMGLGGKDAPADQRAEIVKRLLDRSFLRGIVKRLPTASRRLLRTLIQAGGSVPAAVLFQTSGPEAPPTDYVQPLLTQGLVFFHRQPRAAAQPDRPMMATIPVDLLERLAAILKIDLDG